MNSVHVSTGSDQVKGTPFALIREIEADNGVSLILDLAANEENAKCKSFIGEKENSLSVDWKTALEIATVWDGSRRCAWLNPQFRGVEPWMEKCKLESRKGCRIITLTLSSMGTGWYRDHVEGNALSLVLRRRITFQGEKQPFPKELMISLWGFGKTGLGFWTPPASACRDIESDAPTGPVDAAEWDLPE
jgi:phage N-6-adenine-methyltransferase